MLCSLLAALPLVAPAAPIAAPVAGDPALELREYLESCERFGFSGSVLVARRGKVLLAEGFGLAERKEAVRNTPDTCFEIASATKIFTAVAILQLAAEGKLDLDDPIAEHLPGVPKDKRRVTVRHLLMHTSGMPRRASASGEDLEVAVGRYLATPLTRAPGKKHEYWNGGYALLAGIVEQVSGGSYMDWCRARIFEPAGMRSSGFTGDELFARLPVATGYERGERSRRADEHPYRTYGWQYRGMGGLVTSAPDLLRFHAALQDDTLLSKKWRKVLFAPGDGDYACGVYVLDKPRHIVTHGGDVRGFHSKFSFYPKDDAAIVVLCNVSDVPTWAVTENLQAILFGDRSRYPVPPRPKATKQKDLEELAGRYELAPDEAVELRVEEGALVLSAAGVETTLHLWQAVSAPPGAKRPDAPSPELVALAIEIAQGVADGDPEPLRRAMQPRIPKSWPDRVAGTIWREHVREWGQLQSIRAVGGVSERGSTTVLIALEHGKGSPRLKIIFHGDELGIFDLHGPPSLVEMRLVRDADQLLGFAWMGVQPKPVELVRPRGKGVRTLRVPGNDGMLEYKRAD
jgi:CubicO group peptidase (beta-lactamase class C family)